MTEFQFLKGGEDCAYREPKGEKMPLKHVDEPNLLRHTFPYSEIPRINFDGKIIPVDPPKEFLITDTTFRDGQQARPPYTVEQIVDLFSMLHRLGGPKGIIKKSEFFLYSKKDKEAVRRCIKLGYEYPKITGWIRAREDDLELVKEMELKEAGLLTSVSDYHIFLKLGWNRAKAAENYLKVVRKAIDYEIIPRCHFEDVTRADIYGFVLPFSQMLMEVSEESGMPVLIRLCDTLGYGVTFPGATLPRSIPKLFNATIYDGGVPKEYLEWHGHNDFGKVHANASAAWLYGCTYANGTILGFGERTGNPPIEQLCIEYAGLTGSLNGMDLTVLRDIGDYFREELKVVLPSSCPFVCSDFNVTRAGIHADGTIKNEEIYNIFDTKKILNKPMGVTITDKSGLSGVALWINLFMGLEGKDKIDKKHPGIAKIHEWVQKEYEKGRTTGISMDEMMKLAKMYLPDYFKEGNLKTIKK